MDETHDLTSHSYGDAGVLTYHPIEETAGNHIGSLESSRLVGKTPRFGIVGASAELYAPSKLPHPNGSSDLWRTRREQQRWLIKAHPEAAMGNQAFQKPLAEDMSRYKTEGTQKAGNRPLLCSGFMPNVAGRPGSKPVHFLAAAAGESGESVRLAVGEETRWQWADGGDASLELPVIDPLNKENEVTWAADGLPVMQIKYAEGLSNQDYVHWLMVQKQTSTTIIQPEYHPVPLPVTLKADEVALSSTSALIQLHPIITILHSDTGGNAHSDIVFSGAAFGQKPHLALIDECGFWSIWDLQGTYRVGLNTVRVMLRVRGHIVDGPLSTSSSDDKYRAERHGLIVIANPKRDGIDYSEDTKHLSTSPILLMWRSDRLEAFYLHTGAAVSPLDRFWVPEGKKDRITDVQHCPSEQERVFILTEERLVWIEICSGETAPKIIASISHVGYEMSGLRMTTCQAEDTAMVFVYAGETGQMAVHWFRTERGSNLVCWSRHITFAPGRGEFTSPSGVYQLSVAPLRLHNTGEGFPSGLGSSYKRHGVEFFQVNTLSDALSIRYGIYTTVRSPCADIVLPTKRQGWSTSEQRKQWKKKRRHFLRHFENTFMLPDGMTEKELDSITRRRQVGDEELVRQPEAEAARPSPQPAKMNMEKICCVLRQSMASSQQRGPRGLPMGLFPALNDIFNSSAPGSTLPLLTWQQLVEEVDEDDEFDSVENGMESEIEELLNAADEFKVITQVHRFRDAESASSPVGFFYLYDKFCNLWLDLLGTEFEDQRKAWVAEVARSVLLSSYGLLVQDVPLLGLESSKAVKRQPSQGPLSSSIPESSPHTSQISYENRRGGDDGAIQRLRLLATSISDGAHLASKPLDLLSYWPSQRGQDTEGYMSTVAVASDEKFREARERLQKKEARRKSHVDKFRRQSMIRQSMSSSERDGGDEARGSLPGPSRVDIQSSQPGPSSSQVLIPPVTMSQPVSGAFGTRKKKMKPKRKSGFR